MSDAVAVLTRARDMVAEGWIQGTGRIGDRRCAIQAISDAFREIVAMPPDVGCPCPMCLGQRDPRAHVVWCEVTDAMVDAIGGHTIPGWNDEKGRTQEQVVAAFNRAIKNLTPVEVVPVVTVEEIDDVLVGVGL